MSLQEWEETLTALHVDGPALNTSTSATSLLTLGASTNVASVSKITLPNNFFFFLGRTLKITAIGKMSNIVTTPGTLTLDIRFGSVIVFNGGAVSLNTTAKTNVGWLFEAWLTSRAIGPGTVANVIGSSRFTSESVIGAAAGTTVTAMTAPVVGTGFDSTSAQPVDIFGTFSISNASNSITMQQYFVEALN